MDQQTPEIKKKKSKMIQAYASKSYIHTCSCMWFRLAAQRFMPADGGGRAELCWETQREPGVQGEVSG